MKIPFPFYHFAKREIRNGNFVQRKSDEDEATGDYPKVAAKENRKAREEGFRWLLVAVPIFLAIGSFYLADVEGKRMTSKLQNDFEQERSTLELELSDLSTRIQKQEDSIQWRKQLIQWQEEKVKRQQEYIGELNRGMRSLPGIIEKTENGITILKSQLQGLDVELESHRKRLADLRIENGLLINEKAQLEITIKKEADNLEKTKEKLAFEKEKEARRG